MLKMKKLILTILIATTLLTSTLFANNEFGITGKQWKKISKGTQSLIVSSYLKGVSAGYTTALIYTRELNHIEKVEFLQMSDDYKNVIPNKDLNVHIKNINKFYKVKENKNKDLFLAIWNSVKQ
jgi:hypothetical protein